MVSKLNCWEYKKCGRETGGGKVHEFGICPATTDFFADRLNEGKNGGRICWAIAGTFCDGEIEGTFSRNKFSCINCDFYQLVVAEENLSNYQILMPVQLDHFIANRSDKAACKWKKEN